VFGRAGFDVSQDAVVRVYVPKLRRRLEEFNGGTPDAANIVIPKGSTVCCWNGRQPRPIVAPAETTSAPVAARRANWLGIGIATCCALIVGAARRGIQHGARSGTCARGHNAVWGPRWQPICRSRRRRRLLPVGEANPQTGHHRLVREFFIDSREDFRIMPS
jgi:hypothetical protein